MTISLATSGPDGAEGIESLRDALGDHAKDIRLNLGTVLTPEGAPDLTSQQIAGIALAVAYATKSPRVVGSVEAFAGQHLDEAGVKAAKAAATIMAMNNIYYRFVHLTNHDEVKKLPAKLRMNVIGQPGIAKIDFELMSLGVSAVNGCGMCMEAHLHEVTKAGVTALGAQSAVRIAAVINAAAQAEFIG